MFSTKEITRELKHQLKKRKMTYKELAKSLNISVSGLKKMMNAQDLSFMRLQQIAKALDIDLIDIMNELQSPRLSEGKFSQEIEEFFIKHPKKFDFYWLLTVERLSLEQIKNRWKIKDSELYKILREFDQLGLIQWRSNDKILLPPRKMTRWVGKGPLTAKIQRQWAIDLIDDHYKNGGQEQENSTYRLRYLKLSKSSINELKEALGNLELEFLERSFREQSLEKVQLQDVRLFLNMSLGSFVKRSEW
ncbi:MAG: hypothetical protein Fur0010_27150 [Bdellovibrio sp.]